MDGEAMDALVRRWADRVLVDASHQLPDAVLGSGSVLRPPASRSTIDDAEARLGVTLPSSYRSFLAISDGAYADTAAVAASEPRSDASDPGLGLLPASELRLVRDVVPDAVETWAEIPELEAEPLREAILVSSLTWERGKFFQCLAPIEADLDAGGEPFGLWDKGHSEIDRYPSFAEWLRRSVTDRWYEPGELFLTVNRHLAVADIVSAEQWDVPYFVSQIRRLTATEPTAPTLSYLDKLWRHPEPFIRLASAQVLVRLQPDTGLTRLDELRCSSDPTVALVATCSERVLGS